MLHQLFPFAIEQVLQQFNFEIELLHLQILHLPKTDFHLKVRFFFFNSCGQIRPERDKDVLSPEDGKIDKNCPQGLRLKFQGASFGPIKNFLTKFFAGSFTGSWAFLAFEIEVQMNFKLNLWIHLVGFILNCLLLKLWPLVPLGPKLAATVNCYQWIDKLEKFLENDKVPKLLIMCSYVFVGSIPG